MEDVGRLFAAEAIRNVKAAYFRCMDTKNWAGLADLFTQDADFDVRGALEMPKSDAEYAQEPTIKGRDAIVDFIRAGLAPLVSVHHGHAPEITVISADSAEAVWPMSDILVAPPGAPFRMFRGYGYYFETYACHSGTWRIATLRLRRLFVEMT